MAGGSVGQDLLNISTMQFKKTHNEGPKEPVIRSWLLLHINKLENHHGKKGNSRIKSLQVDQFFNVYFWEKERECEWGRGRERGRHRIWSRLQALSCQHRAWCRARTHKLRDHDLSWSRMLKRLSHPGAPRWSNFEIKMAYAVFHVMFM